VEGLGVGGRVGAELVGEGLTEVLVGGEGGGGLAGGGVGEHDGAPGGLVEGVGGGGGAGVGQGAGMVADGQGGVPGQVPGSGGEVLGLAARGLGPVGVGLVGQERAPAEQDEGTLGGGEGEGRLAGQAGLGLGGEPFRLVQVDLDPGPGHEPPALAVAGDRLRPSTARSRLTRVARLASGSLGSRPPHRASAATSAGTTEPRRANSSFSSVRPLRLASSAAGTTRPSTATARTPSTCTRRLVCCLMHGFWRSPSPVARAAAAAGPGKPPQAPAADPCVANRAAHSLQPPASSGTPSSRSAAAWSWW
jgi:hypothetical protein